MAYQIKAQQLAVGEEAVIKGTLGFSRWLTQLLDGEDLQKSIAAERQRGSQYPNMNVRCEAELLNPEVVFKDAQPNGTEKYLHERIFSKKDGAMCFRLERNKTLPKFGVRQQDGTIKEFDPAGKHFGEGNVVTAYYKVYQPKSFANKGVGLQAIVFENEPIYYQGAGLPGGEWTRLPETAAASAQTAPQAAAPAPAAPAAPQSAPADPWATQAAPASAAAPSNDGFAPAADSPWN